MRLAINSDSWVLSVARYGQLEDEGRTDLCSVVRAFLWGLIRAPFWVALLGSLGAGLCFILVVNPIIAIVAYLVEGLPIAGEIWLTFAFWFIALWFAYETWASEERKASPIRSTVQIAKAAYRGWKEKTCVLVEIT